MHFLYPLILGLGLRRCPHTSIFIKTPSLEGLPTKAKEEDPSPHEMRLSPWTSTQYSVFPGLGDQLLLLLLLLLLLFHFI